MGVTYEQAYADHEYLWNVHGPAADMTGGYVDQEDLQKLLRKPSKSTARACLISQIEYWFQVGTDLGVQPRIVASCDQMVREIADRYSITI